MNKCPTFSGRDTEWSERSFIFESVAAMANLEPAMEGAFTGSAEEPVAELTLEMKLSAKQLYCLLVNTVRGKALTLVRSAEKHHGIAAWKRIKTEYQPDAAERHTAMLMGIMQPGWDSRGAANTFLDQLTEEERRIREYEGESLETFSDGMKIAVVASHAPESILDVVRLAAGPAGEVSSGAPEHVRVSSIWPHLRQGWPRSGVGTQQCKCDTDGRRSRWQRQGKGMLRVWTSRPRSERV